MRLAAYCRVSTERGEQLESLENQKIFFAEFARRQGHQLTEIYADEGISGKQMQNRQAFLRMLADAEQHAFDMVAVKDISRFSRNTVDFLNATRRLKALGIEVQFLSQNQSILGSSEFILTIFSALAQEESAGLSRRVKFGKRVNARRGRVPNLLYGYDRADLFTLTVNEAEAAAVREIFNGYCAGLGFRKLSDQLNARGIPAKKGGPWSPKAVRRVVENPIYSGVLENNKYETTDFLTGARQKLPPEQHFFHDRPALAIVSKTLYAQAQRMRESRAPAPTTRYSGVYLLSGLIRCADCGSAFVRRAPGKWRCSGRNQRGAAFCPNGVTVEEAALLRLLEEWLQGCAPDQAALRAETDCACARSAPAPVREAERLGVLRERCRALYLNGLGTLEELREQLARLDVREAALDTPAPIPAERCLSPAGWSNAELRELVERITVAADGTATVLIHKLEK